MKSSFWALLVLLVGGLLGGCGSKAAEPIWDLPALIGQPLDVAQKTLGKPQSETPVSTGIMQSLWAHDDVTLRATWKSSNRRVTSYEVISRDEEHALREGETAPLLVPGQLKEGDPRYSTELIEAANKPLFYTGVKVVPAPKNYAVTIRVTGSEALLQVVYQVSSAAGKSEDLITIAPWETAFILPDDATISLMARVSQKLDGRPVQMKVEIIADGKVVTSDESTGRMVSCNYEL